jgi:ribosomal RNA-processing protein 7
VQRALSATQSISTPSSILWPKSSAPRGLACYSSLYDHLRPSLTVIRAHADTSLELFDYQEAAKKAHLKSQYKKGEAIVDDDGFTLVTRGGAYGQSVGGGVAVASKSRRKKKKLPKEKDEFYASQLHEEKRDGKLYFFRDKWVLNYLSTELMKLKRQWEDDKTKLSKLRQERKFKPY